MSANSTDATYMFVFRYPADEPAPTPDETRRVLAKWRQWITDMKARGLYVAGDPLEDAPAKVLRGPGGTLVSDGPFAEAKEVVAGYVMITAKDFAAATVIAQDCPALDLPRRSVEVRQLSPLDGRLHSL